MEVLLTFAAKSLLIAGATLLVLHLLRGRSAAERSMVAHLGLLVLVLVPLGSMFLPQLVVSLPLAEAAPIAPDSTPAVPAGDFTALPAAPLTPSGGAEPWWPLLYAIPAALLLGELGDPTS